MWDRLENFEFIRLADQLVQFLSQNTSGQKLTWQLIFYAWHIDCFFLCLKEFNLSLLFFSLKTPKDLYQDKGVWYVHLPKKRACSSRGRCKAQSSLTLWSTTISVIKITAMLHLRTKTHKSSECTRCQQYLLLAWVVGWCIEHPLRHVMWIRSALITFLFSFSIKGQ